MFFLGFYIPEDGILHSHRRENLKSYKMESVFLDILSRTQHGQLCLEQACADIGLAIVTDTLVSMISSYDLSAILSSPSSLPSPHRANSMCATARCK
jgi:hypothetical protein